MKKAILTICILALSACALSAQAPAPPANPLASEIKQAYDRVANNLLAMAVKMPEENYGFKRYPRFALSPAPWATPSTTKCASAPWPMAGPRRPPRRT